MKQLLIYITLIICIYANAQPDKINAINEELTKVENDWRETVDKQLKQLQAMSLVLYKLQNNVNNLTERLNYQSDQLTQLTLKSWRDSLKIEGLENRIEYTQSFIKDSVYFALANVDPIDNNPIDSVDNYNDAWTVSNNEYSYNAAVNNYAYLFFTLKENLKPQTTYIISFNIELTDISNEALLNFWLYDEASNQRTGDSYYGNGKHSLEVTVNDKEKFRMAIRARNNLGGSFKLNELKVEDKK